MAKKKNYTIAILLVSRRGQHKTKIQMVSRTNGRSQSLFHFLSLFPLLLLHFLLYFTSNGAEGRQKVMSVGPILQLWFFGAVLLGLLKPSLCPAPRLLLSSALLAPVSLGLLLLLLSTALFPSSHFLYLFLPQKAVGRTWMSSAPHSVTLQMLTCLVSYLSTSPSRVEQHHEEIQS